jgi:hypothetical protein
MVSAFSALTLAALAALVVSPAASGQGIIYGGITGSVADSTGAVIPNASIEARNQATGVVLQVTSNGEGVFLIPNVPIGSYSLTATASGFGKNTLNNVAVVAGNQTPVKVTLQVGGTAETVQVEGAAADIINTESAQSETSIDTEQLASAPVAGAMDDITLVAPGVTIQHDNFSNTNGENYSVNSQRGRSNNSEIDGQSNNDNSIGGPSFFFSNQDALQEVQVVTSDMGAQYGRNMGAVVNYITKSGANSFHGSGFEYYLGSWGSSLLQNQKDPQWGFCPSGSNAAFASANGCELITVPRFTENLWGGTLGGPVIKNKMWFFGSTFWAHEYQAGAFDTTAGGLYPDPTGMTQLQAAYPSNPAVSALAAIGPYSITTGNPTPVPVASTACTSLGGTSNANGSCNVPVSDGVTASSIEMAQVGRVLSSHVLDQEELGRLDYQFTRKDRLYLRYAYQNNPWQPAWYLFSQTGIPPAGVATGAIPQVNGITHEVGGDVTHIFTPRMTNAVRYSFQQSKIGFYGGTVPSCTDTDLSTCSSLVTLGSGFPATQFGYGANSFITPGSLPQGRAVKVNQVQDNATWTKGNHTIYFGGEFDYQDSPNFGLPNIQGNFNFTPGAACGGGACFSPCNNGISCFLQGTGTLTLAAGNITIPFKESDVAFYFQDNWKMMRGLTVNLGVRYEFFGQAVNLLHNESVAQQTGPNPFWDTTLPLSATTYPYTNPNYRNVEPRVGLAYNPTRWPKMVVHAGFAIDVDPAFYNIFLNAAQSAPLVNANTIICNGTTVSCIPTGGLTEAAVQAADAKYLPTGLDPRVDTQYVIPTNFKNPMDETWTFGVQYQVAPSAVWDVRYVGSHTFGQFQALNGNPDLLAVQSAFPNYGAGVQECTDKTAIGYGRENCNYDLETETGNTAFLIYNAMQSSLTLRQFRNTVTGTVSYTFSRAISNTSEIFSTGSGGNTSAYAQDPLNPDLGERGVDGNSYPNLVGLQLTFTEPWYSKQHGIMGRLLGGYFLNSFYQYNAGQPYSVSQAFSVTSSKVTIPATDSAAVAAEVTSNFCDFGFAQAFGSQCRPILANPGAPIQAVGINVGNGVYENYATGAVADRSTFHWLWNNQAEAIALGNPFPGVGRNTLRGDGWNDLDASIGKNFKATERVSFQLTFNVFNVLNRAYYGTPDLNIEDSPSGLFQTDTFTGTISDSGAGAGAYYAGFGNRNIQLSGHINF